MPSKDQFSISRKRHRKRRFGFTMLEVMMGVGIGSMLINAIYFFYTNFYRVGDKTAARLELNEVAELKLDRVVRELQLAVKFTEFKPDTITFQRPAARLLAEGAKFQINMEGGNRTLERVTFRRRENVDGTIVFERREGFGLWEELLKVNSLDEKIFTGWVIPSSKEQKRSGKFRIYDRFKGFRSDLERIPLVRIRLKMKKGQAKLEILTKAYLPPVHSRVLQPNWNSDS